MQGTNCCTVHEVNRLHQPFGEVPEAYAAVLRVADDELLSRVEDDTRHVVVVAPTCVHLPGLGIWWWKCIYL